MSLIFGVFVVQWGDTYHCLLCDRLFLGLGAILSHCRMTRQHAWCPRCQVVFPSTYELAEHNSSYTVLYRCWVCPISPFFNCAGEMMQHLETVHYWCRICDRWGRCFTDLEAHYLEEHFGCPICHRPFISAEALASHSPVHQLPTESCPCCPKIYMRFSHVLAHLERSACSSEGRLLRVTEEFDVSRQIRNHPCDDLRYHCQHCHRKFNTLSSLFAHVEVSGFCNHLIGHGGILTNLKAYILHWL